MGAWKLHHLAELAAGLAVVLLVALLTVLYTGSSTKFIDRGLINNPPDNASIYTSAPASPWSSPASANHQIVLKTQATAADRGNVSNVHATTGKSEVESPQPRAPSKERPELSWEHWKNNILPNDGDDFEYILLAKANQNSFEDPLDESSETERHHSGHFRHSQNKVWDPHPQYEFKAFGQKFHLNLREDGSFAPLGITVTQISKNTSRHEIPTHHVGCFYSGILEGDSKSAVAVSLCHGMTGHIKTSTANYVIKPSQNWTENDGLPLQHQIYRLSKIKKIPFNDEIDSTASNDLPSKVTNKCGVDDVGDENEVVIKIDDTSESAKIYVGDELHTGRKRTRRHLSRLSYLNNYTSSSYDEDDVSSFALEDDQDSNFDTSDYWKSRRTREYFIEVMVVADQKMVDYHGSSLISYILVLMNTVSRIYKDPSIGNPISIAVINIKQIDEIFGTKQHGGDEIVAADMLKKFCHWQEMNNPEEPSPEHHDAALLLTRENLCHNQTGQKRCDTLGLAELGRMCTRGSSCAIVQDNGLATAFTIAHEIGHVLSMPHDDEPKCGKFQNHPEVSNIMSRMLDDNTVPWEWSKCSLHFVTEFLDSASANCLLDEPRRVMSHRYGNRLPGQDYSKNVQCELVYGKGSEICPHMVSDVCKRLWCTVPDWNERGEQCHTQHMPWADGTVCGPEKWCHRGECVSRQENLPPVDGQWGRWSEYGECSRTCGGGIMKKYRECNNPPPKNGGNYCTGERIRYRSCATHECSPGSIDFREEQCAAFNGDNRNIPGLLKNVTWHAKYSRLLPEDRCKLFCQMTGNQYYMLRDKVVDGTACGPDTFHVCVNGHCKMAGCDHMLNSRAELDTCGVCRGDNLTCQKISGAYNSSEYGYTKITEIPAGSSYIDIRQHGWMNSHNDSNYLAVRLKDSRRYILNGDFMVMHRKLIVHPGVTIDYSGPEQIVERINSSRPIHKDLVLEVLSVGDVNPPQVTYEYTVPIKILNKFTWSLRNWTACDRMCQGQKHRRAVCQNPESREVVSEDYCPPEKRPAEKSQSCNNHCQLEWQEVANSRSECSADCGPGNLTVKHECVEVSFAATSAGGKKSRKLPGYACYHLDRPDDRRACMGQCEHVRWRYGEWGACSASCGQHGFQNRTGVCVDDNGAPVPEHQCRSQAIVLSRSCNRRPCPTWTYADWTPCSVSCGIGKRERRRYCQVDNRVVSPSQCANPSNDIVESCDAGPCPTWQTGDWSSCSVTCGDGIRRRTVDCKKSDGSIADSCDSSSRPINLISCALESCPVRIEYTPVTSTAPALSLKNFSYDGNEIDGQRTSYTDFMWIVEGFKKCSKSCGGGFAYQIIKCINIESGKAASNLDYCDSRQRPKDLIACNEHQCPYWKIGGWSQCDVRCGDGYQHRQVLCQNLRGEIMNDSDCSEKSRPRHVRKCQKYACTAHNSVNAVHNLATYKWRAGTWSDCSASCGTGVRKREVTCHRVNHFGWLDSTPSHNACSPADKPTTEQYCKIRGCNDQYYWTAGAWKKCSQSCGRKGRQIRRLFCRDSQRRKVRRLNCPANLRPQRKRKCNQKPCTGPTSCLEVKTRLMTDLDGEYTLFVGGRYISIYCHNMKDHEPREYLTLPAGERENYSEIYDKRLKDPNTCPYRGRRNETCDCLSETVAISGRTMFQKIRINIHTLFVIVDDYEFTMKMGRNNVEYGKAGDCYSQVNCPQGRFAINLSGTQLVLAPEVNWPEQQNLHSVINKINDQRIVGKCGGYCGFCTPTPGIKLNVLFH